MSDGIRIDEIPRDAWVARLNDFTAHHEGWLISVAILGTDLGAQSEIRDLPLIGVSADRVDHDGTIAISVARSAAEHMTHIIRGAQRVYIERTVNGARTALLIESADGLKTIVRAKAAASQPRT
jgi:hypothetical protein